jgi:hypothetical protein
MISLGLPKAPLLPFHHLHFDQGQRSGKKISCLALASQWKVWQPSLLGVLKIRLGNELLEVQSRAESENMQDFKIQPP